MLLVLFSPCIFATYHISSNSPTCRLQWRVTGVMLADTLERYKQRERSLVSDFEKVFPEIYHGIVEDATHDNLVQWVERFSPRRYVLVKCIYCILLLGTHFVQYAKSLKLLRKLIKNIFRCNKVSRSSKLVCFTV